MPHDGSPRTAYHRRMSDLSFRQILVEGTRFVSPGGGVLTSRGVGASRSPLKTGRSTSYVMSDQFGFRCTNEW